VTTRLRNGLYVWRYQGSRMFFRLLLFKLGLTHTHPDPDHGGTTFHPESRGRVVARELVGERFQSCSPLRVFTVPPSPTPRISIVTDSINSGSLYGGVGTAMILGALLAEACKARLRIVTRTERARPGNLDHVLALYGIELSREVEFAFAPCFDGHSEIDVLPGEEFLTTSWWTTAATMASIPHESIVYLLQEDERTFYPFGDDQLRCEAIMGSSDIRFVLNTRLLFDHLVASGLENIATQGVYFEPAFPREVFHPRPAAETGKRTLVFYARPNHLRNLFYFGIDVLEDAIARGVLDTEAWHILLVGKDIPELVFSNGYEPERYENMAWADYAALAGTADVGLCLMSSVHPSYPPLDFAASGAVVVTNRWGAKRDLSAYSDNILLGDLDREAMVATLSDGLRLAMDEDERKRNYLASGIATDWRDSLRDVVARIARRL
jgi:O-antigen biosynthesis protein